MAVVAEMCSALFYDAQLAPAFFLNAQYPREDDVSQEFFKSSYDMEDDLSVSVR